MNFFSYALREYAVLQIQILHINLIKQNMLLSFLKVFQSQTKYIFSEFIYWWPIKKTDYFPNYKSDAFPIKLNNRYCSK